MDKAFIGFKGKNNASCLLVQELTDTGYFLTNSFEGLKRDIELIPIDPKTVYMFGIDKHLNHEVRIEKSAVKDGRKRYSALDLPQIADKFKAVELNCSIVNEPTHSLCNEAYWLALEKFCGNVVFIHIPSIKNFNPELGYKIKTALSAE